MLPQEESRLNRFTYRGSPADSNSEMGLEAWRYKSMEHSFRDKEFLTQALKREICSTRNESCASQERMSPHKNLGETQGHCLYRRPFGASNSNLASNTTWATDQDSVASLRGVQNSALYQRPRIADNSSNFSNTASPMSSSDQKDSLSRPDSPFITGSMPTSSDTADGRPQLTMDTGVYGSEEMKMSFLGSTFPDIGTSAMAGASQVKLEDSVGKGMTDNALPPSWAATGAERAAALSAQASVGAATTKVSKRRSRATNKPPITVLSADTANFRAMVQKLTGIPAPPPMHSMQHNRFQLWSSPSGVPLLKPQPTRPLQSIPGLPTLDTSSFLLLDGAPNLAHAQRAFFPNGSLLPGLSGLPFLQTSQPQVDAALASNLVDAFGLNRTSPLMNNTNFPWVNNSNLRAFFPDLMDPPKQRNANTPGAATMPMPWEPMDVKEASLRGKFFPEKLRDECVGAERLNEGLKAGAGRGDSMSKNSKRELPQGGMLQGGREDTGQVSKARHIESLLFGSDKADGASRQHTVDSWLVSDGAMANQQATKVELAHSA